MMNKFINLSSILCLALIMALASCQEEEIAPIEEENVAFSSNGLSDASVIGFKFIGAEYVEDRSAYLVLYVEDGTRKAYYGDKSGWTLRGGNNNTPQQSFFGNGTMTGFAIEEGQGFKGLVFGEACKNGNCGVWAESILDVSNKPWFARGFGKKVGDLVEFIDAEYVEDRNAYLVIGKDASGIRKAYYGDKSGWTLRGGSNNTPQQSFFGNGPMTGFAIEEGQGFKGLVFGEVSKNGNDGIWAEGIRDVGSKPWFARGFGSKVN